LNQKGIPPTIVGFDQFGDLFADPKLWLEQGWVDYLAPQLYWRVDPPVTFLSFLFFFSFFFCFIKLYI